MTFAEKIISVSTINGCATLAEHICSIGSGDKIYIIRNPLIGQLQKIDVSKGVLQKEKIISGLLQLQHAINGQLQVISTIEGIINDKENLEGELKCL